MEHRHLSRLDPTAYCGETFVHWSMTVMDRAQGWLGERFHGEFVAILRWASRRYAVVIPAYILMPDHLHVLAAGITDSSDQLLWARAVRRRVNELLHPLRLQKQGYDHVLRAEERRPGGFAKVVDYICENPVEDGLVGDPRAWPFVGAVVESLPELDPRSPDFHERWWDYWNGLSP